MLACCDCSGYHFATNKTAQKRIEKRKGRPGRPLQSMSKNRLFQHAAVLLSSLELFVSDINVVRWKLFLLHDLLLGHFGYH